MLHIAEDAPTTAPMDYRPIKYEKHIAECSHVHEDDLCHHGEGSGPFVWPLVIVGAVVAVAGAWHLIAWLA